MAWIFGLNAECGPSQDDARELERHFANWPSGVFRHEADWWCAVAPEGLSRCGITTDAEAAAMTVAGHELCSRLRTARPVYRYALVGVETELFRTYQELIEEEDLSAMTGLVLAEEVWARAGRPGGFEAFAVGYRWIPYAGERR